MPVARLHLLPLAALLSLGGCVLPEVDFEGRGCPCATGYVCVQDVCLPESAAPPSDGGAGDDAAVDAAVADSGVTEDTGVATDAAGVDAASDAGFEDAAPMDAAEDSGVTDGPVPDTGVEDAGFPDTGIVDSGVPPTTCLTDRHCNAPSSICEGGLCTAGCASGGPACGAGRTCDVSTGHCFNVGATCAQDAECGAGAPEGVCVDGQCAYGCAVSTAAACTGDRICAASGFCEVSFACITDPDCQRPDFLCQAGTCVRRCDEPGAYPCAGNSTCNATSGLCEGGLPLGQDCTSDAECISGFCLSLTSPSAQSFCSRACGATADCPLENTCRRVDGTKLCIRRQAVSGLPDMDLASGLACSNPGNRCQSLVCADPGQTCLENCTSDASCAAFGNQCVRVALNMGATKIQLCAAPLGALEAGQVCPNDDDSLCQSGVCNRYSNTCAGGCCSNDDCPSNERCLVYDLDSNTPMLTCQTPSGSGTGAVGDPCAGPTACETDVCAPENPRNLSSQLRCTTHCCTDLDCAGYPGGGRCAPMPAVGVSAFVNYCVPR